MCLAIFLSHAYYFSVPIMYNDHHPLYPALYTCSNVDSSTVVERVCRCVPSEIVPLKIDMNFWGLSQHSG